MHPIVTVKKEKERKLSRAVDNDRGNEDGDLCWSSGRFLGEEEESLARSRRGKFRDRSFQATVKKTGGPLGVGHCKAVGNETRRGRGWRIAVDGAKWKRRN